MCWGNFFLIKLQKKFNLVNPIIMFIFSINLFAALLSLQKVKPDNGIVQKFAFFKALQIG